MGEDLKKTGQDRGETGAGGDGNGGSAAAAAAGAGGNTGGNGSGGSGSATAGGSTGSGKKAKEEKKPVEVPVIVPEPKDPEKKKAPAKKKAAKKEPEKGVKSDDICKLLITVSGIAASRPDMAHWKITEKEAKSIADPLCNIIEKSDVFSKIAEHSDAIALTTACVTVFAPRAMITVMQVKEKGKTKRNVIKHNKSEALPDKSGKSAGSNTSSGGKSANVAADLIDDPDVYSAFNSIM